MMDKLYAVFPAVAGCLFSAAGVVVFVFVSDVFAQVGMTTELMRTGLVTETGGRRAEILLPEDDPYCSPDSSQNSTVLADTVPSTDVRAGIVNRLLAFCDLPDGSGGTRKTSRVSVDFLPNIVVDWVMVELRRASGVAGARDSTSTVVMKKAGLLLSNGRVVDAELFTDASSGVNDTSTLDDIGCLPIASASSSASCPDLFFDLESTDHVVSGYVFNSDDDLYVVVLHRNHLGIMSALPAASDATYNYYYDFAVGSSTAADAPSGGLSSMAMIGGDINVNRSVGFNGDGGLIIGLGNPLAGGNLNLSDGYFNSDVNMSGGVGFNDDYVFITGSGNPLTGGTINRETSLVY